MPVDLICNHTPFSWEENLTKENNLFLMFLKLYRLLENYTYLEESGMLTPLGDIIEHASEEEENMENHSPTLY